MGNAIVDLSLQEVKEIYDFLTDHWDDFEGFCERRDLDPEEIHRQLKVKKEDLATHG